MKNPVQTLQKIKLKMIYGAQEKYRHPSAFQLLVRMTLKGQNFAQAFEKQINSCEEAYENKQIDQMITA